MKDVDRRRDIDDEPDDGTNGEERKGSSLLHTSEKFSLSGFPVDVGSPVPAHDELDTAE